jgi:hypothetical protein
MDVARSGGTVGSGMKSRISWPVVGLVLMSVYPFVRITAHNLGHTISVGSVFLWALATAAVGLGVVAVTEWTSRGSGARVATTLIPLVWLTYNFNIFERNHHQPHLLWVVAAVTVAGLAAIASQWRWVRTLLPVWAGLLVVVFVVQLVAYSSAAEAAESNAPLYGPIADRPDVWVFIPDGYTTASEVKRQAGVDISGFQVELKDRGFATPDGLASFPLTYLSLASMLDQDYLVSAGDDVRERGPFYDRIKGANRTVDQFRAWGYTDILATTSMWEGSECSDLASLCVTGPMMSRTSRVILSITPFEPLVDYTSHVENVARYSNPSHIVDEVRQLGVEGPVFVVAHLIEPHPPGFRTADCDIRTDMSLEFNRAGWDADEFRQSVECLNRQLVDAVDHILETDPDSVIVIQGDHGTHLGYDLPVPPSHRYEVFSAVRGCPVPDPLAAVNTMRLVTACLAGSAPELLDYEAYWLDGVTLQSR